MNYAELADRAVMIKHQGNNCCQAVVAALAEQTTLPAETLRQLAAGFGGGMGTREGTCGALVGAGIAAGLRTGGNGVPGYGRALCERFRRLSGAVVCKTLKGTETGIPLCSCDQCVKNAVLAYGDVMDPA